MRRKLLNILAVHSLFLCVATVAICFSGCTLMLIGIPAAITTDDMARKTVAAIYRNDKPALLKLGMEDEHPATSSSSFETATKAIAESRGRLASPEGHFVFDSLLADAYCRQYSVDRVSKSPTDPKTIEVRVWFRQRGPDRVPFVCSVQYLDPLDPDGK
jgi:hypothetical protein